MPHALAPSRKPAACEPGGANAVCLRCVRIGTGNSPEPRRQDYVSVIVMLAQCATREPTAGAATAAGAVTCVS